MINFFKIECRHEAITNDKFGLCDPQNGSPAYIDVENEGEWIATVVNPESLPVNFTAIDNCIDVRRHNGDMDLRCDGLIDYDENIIFIELKNQITGGAPAEGMAQIETTISHFKNNHNLDAFKHKRAFVINKKRPQFQVIAAEDKRRFFDNYRVRINVGGEIKI